MTRGVGKETNFVEIGMRYDVTQESREHLVEGYFRYIQDVQARGSICEFVSHEEHQWSIFRETN